MIRGVKGWLGCGKMFMNGKTSRKRRGIGQRNDDNRGEMLARKRKTVYEGGN